MKPPPGNLRLLVLDVDGVLTDGGLYYGPGDVELKRFHTRDGLAMKASPGAGLAIAILTARSSVALTRRVNELGIELVVQGSGDKARDLRRLLTAAEATPEQTAYMGDDLADLGPMKRCGYAIAPADAASDVRAAADLVTQARGGHGAVREAIETLLRASGRWEQVLAGYTAE